ncbi:hypothetical protein L7F22_002566 [Adiantum nelumboides]|nr:hypothetical protein [Adiantum nelumboides]
MSQLKQKLVHAAMPHTWLLYMLKHRRTKPGSHHDCKSRSSQCKKPAKHRKKHSPASILHNKANDIHFPTTLIRKASLKACRDGLSGKQASWQENLALYNDLDTEFGQMQRLHRCTMSPTSRKLCSHTDVELNANPHHCPNMPQYFSPMNDPCYPHNASKNKIFKLDVKQLEMKLNALCAEERWRKTSMSTLPSVAVPSPSLDGELDYGSYFELDSLATSLWHHPSRTYECRRFGVKNTSNGKHSNLYCSSPGKADLTLCKSFLEGDESFLTCAENRKVVPKIRRARYLESDDLEVLNRLQLQMNKPDLRHNSGGQGTRPWQYSETKAGTMIKNNQQQIHQESVFASEILQSVKQRAKNQQMKSCPVQEKGTNGSQCVLNTNYAERYDLDQLSVSSSEDSDLSHTMEATQIYKSLQKKQKLTMHIKGKRYPKHNSINRYNTPITTPVHNDFDDGCLELRSEFFRSLSTKSLDSSLSHSTFSSIETTSSIDGDCFKSRQLVPAISGFSTEGFVDATASNFYSTSILAQNVNETGFFVDDEELMNPGRSLPCSEENTCPYEINFLAAKHPVQVVTPVCHHTSSAGKAVDETSTLSKISIMECTGNTGKNNVKGSITSRLNSLNGITGPAHQYATSSHVHMGSSDDDPGDDDGKNYADDERSVSGFDSTPYVVHHDMRRGERSYESGCCYDNDQVDFKSLLEDDCEKGVCGYQADGENDEFCAGHKESSRTHNDDSESISYATERRMNKSMTCLLENTVQQKSRALHDKMLQAEMMWSYNMHQDFKEAMVANIESMSNPLYRNNQGEAYLLELLHCYLALNRRCHHRIIIKAFCDVCEDLKQLGHFDSF